jgi:hypothetical protein
VYTGLEQLNAGDDVLARHPLKPDLLATALGARGHVVRLNGLVFDAIAARLQHRERSDPYHSAFEVHGPEGRFVIEQAPAWGESDAQGVVAEGPVGTRTAAGSASSGTCAAGARASFRMLPRRSTARSASATIAHGHREKRRLAIRS